MNYSAKEAIKEELLSSFSDRSYHAGKKSLVNLLSPILRIISFNQSKTQDRQVATSLSLFTLKTQELHAAYNKCQS